MKNPKVKPSKERIKRLEQHLRQENPILSGCVESFQKLDRIACAMGLADANDSFTNQVSWWPVISVLGTFSAGKSTFLNQYVGENLQRTGNQAVDDKFTVICYGTGEATAALPGLALDSDPRFPFYQISQNIEQVAQGEGRRVDSYLQLKTAKAESLRGKIIIDSPGFDADRQRTSTLAITEHIINLSDLVLVFFDARHPEPGAMGDTLEHLVAKTVNRPDATKFLYILNQIDTAAREDNPEDVVAAWQRALAQHGLTAGRFYRIYSRSAVLPIEDGPLRERMERKRDEDIEEIENRIRQVEVERAYRVVGVLEKTAKHIRDVLVPQLAGARKTWRRRTMWFSAAVFSVLGGLFAWWSWQGNHWQGYRFEPFAKLAPEMQIGVAAIATLILWLIYSQLRDWAGRSVLRGIKRSESLGEEREKIAEAFSWNVKAWWNSLASTQPRGWNWRRKRQLEKVLADADGFVQSLNDQYTRPSGPAS
jgi:GTPase SAR1 family protein